MDKTQLQILRLFSKNLTQELTINQIKNEVKRSYHFIYDKTQELIQQKILNTKVQGHSTVCSLNLKNEKIKALLLLNSINEKEDFLNKKPQLNSLFNQLISNVTSKIEIFSIILFGSYAKGTETKQSDLDLLFIVGEKDQNKIIPREIHTLEAEYGKEINPIVVDAKIFKTMLHSKMELNVGKEVLANHIILYGAEMFWKLVLEVKNE